MTPPASGEATSPLWRIWLPLVLASIASAALFAWWGREAAREGDITPTRWSEVASEQGLNHVNQTGLYADESVHTTLGAGVVAFDYDRDGDTDLYFLNGGAWPWEEAGGRVRSLAGYLYRNDGRAGFSDETMNAGLTPTFVGMAGAASDFDGDGWLDLLVTGVGGLALYRNQGNGTFSNVTEQVGLAPEPQGWQTGATWLDINGDQHLDLIIMSYARWPEEIGLEEALDVASGGRTYGTPSGFIASFPLVYLNDGQGRFVVAPDHAGLEPLDPETKRPRSWGLAALPVDANEDQRVDLVLVFGEGTAQLFLARPEGGFRPVAFGSETRREGSAFLAGAAWGGGPGTALDARSYALLRWANRRDTQRAVEGTNPWGDVAFDVDLDGRPEIVRLGSRLEAHPGRQIDTEGLRGRLSLAQWQGEQWRESQLGVLSEQSWNEDRLARAAAFADFDGDGDLDLAVGRSGDSPLLLRNDGPRDLPWLGVDLSAAGAGAIGARVEVVTPRARQTQTFLPVHTLLGQSPAQLHFGLKIDSRVRKVIVYWPDGYKTEVREPPLNRVLRISR